VICVQMLGHNCFKPLTRERPATQIPTPCAACHVIQFTASPSDIELSVISIGQFASPSRLCLWALLRSRSSAPVNVYLTKPDERVNI